MNRDGVDDKIIQRVVEKQAYFFPYRKLEDEVLYGVDINGTRLCLQEEEFEKLKNKILYIT